MYQLLDTLLVFKSADIVFKDISIYIPVNENKKIEFIAATGLSIDTNVSVDMTFFIAKC